MKNTPEGRGSHLAGALESGSPTPQHRDSNPGGAVPGRVVHCKREPYDVYIGRTRHRNGAFGNPFVLRIDTEKNRRDVIGLFKLYARERISSDPEFRLRVKELHGKVLGCWCAPKPCHGDVLLELAAELANEADSRGASG